MNTSSFSIDFSTSVENTASTAVLGTTRTNSNAIFNPTYNQRTKNSNSTSKSQESKTLFGKSNSSSNKTWQGIINDLNSRVDYSATSNGKNAVNITEMNYKEVSSYFRSKMSKDVLSAGTSYYTRGKGSMFRYPEAKAQNV